jgi:DNA-binding PadR family transcriptional regulator
VEAAVARRGAALELAVLGLLADAPMHGYELRKQVNALLGWGRVLSYGTLYPCLKTLLRQGDLVEDLPEPAAVTSLVAPRPRRGRIVYRLSSSGRASFAARMREAGPAAWEDDNFGIYFAFFSSTDAPTRLRILEGRRSRLEERLHAARSTGTRTRLRTDAYARELHRHGVESVEREVAWLTTLVEAERAGLSPPAPDVVEPSVSGSARTEPA